jgi:serine/threonine-protein kinase SRPK3
MIDTSRPQASDIWALACCIFELRSNEKLFPEWTAQSVRTSIQRTMGALPQNWLDKITVDSSGRKVLLLSPEILEKGKDRLDRKIRRIGDWKPWFNMTVQQRRDALIAEFGEEMAFRPNFFLEERINAEPPPAKLSEEEFTDFYDLLSRMLRYRPEDRLTIRGVLEHPWLNKKYEQDFDATDPWISVFYWGQDISEDPESPPVRDSLGSPGAMVSSTELEG